MKGNKGPRVDLQKKEDQNYLCLVAIGCRTQTSLDFCWKRIHFGNFRKGDDKMALKINGWVLSSLSFPLSFLSPSGPVISISLSHISLSLSVYLSVALISFASHPSFPSPTQSLLWLHPSLYQTTKQPSSQPSSFFFRTIAKAESFILAVWKRKHIISLLPFFLCSKIYQICKHLFLCQKFFCALFHNIFNSCLLEYPIKIKMFPVND